MSEIAWFVGHVAALAVAVWVGHRIGFDRAWKKAGGEICNMGYGEVLIAPTCRRCGTGLRAVPEVKP